MTSNAVSLTFLDDQEESSRRSFKTKTVEGGDCSTFPEEEVVGGSDTL